MGAKSVGVSHVGGDSLNIHSWAIITFFSINSTKNYTFVLLQV